MIRRRVLNRSPFGGFCRLAAWFGRVSWHQNRFGGAEWHHHGVCTRIMYGSTGIGNNAPNRRYNNNDNDDNTTTTMGGGVFIAPQKSSDIFDVFTLSRYYVLYYLFFFYSKRNNNLRGTGFLTCSHRKYLLDFQGVKNTGGGLLLSCGCRCCCGWCCRKTLYPFVDNHQKRCRITGGRAGYVNRCAECL